MNLSGSYQSASPLSAAAPAPVGTPPAAQTQFALGTIPQIGPVLALFPELEPPPMPARRARKKRRRRRARDQSELPFPRRFRVRDSVRPVRESELPKMPATRGDCIGPDNPRVDGICPVFRCKFNLALWVKENGAIKVEGAADETDHPTLRSHRPVSKRTLERLAAFIVDRARRLNISLCVIDLADAIAAEKVELRDVQKDDGDLPDWTYALIARILGVSPERARCLGRAAEEKLKARLLASGLAPDDHDEAAAPAPPDGDEEDDELALLVPTPTPPPPRASTAPLVQIRRKPKPPEPCK